MSASVITAAVRRTDRLAHARPVDALVLVSWTAAAQPSAAVVATELALAVGLAGQRALIVIAIRCNRGTFSAVLPTSVITTLFALTRAGLAGPPFTGGSAWAKLTRLATAVVGAPAWLTIGLALAVSIDAGVIGTDADSALPPASIVATLNGFTLRHAGHRAQVVMAVGRDVRAGSAVLSASVIAAFVAVAGAGLAQAIIARSKCIAGSTASTASVISALFPSAVGLADAFAADARLGSSLTPSAYSATTVIAAGLPVT